jgi:hypothetical protein
MAEGSETGSGMALHSVMTMETTMALRMVTVMPPVRW